MFGANGAADEQFDDDNETPRFNEVTGATRQCLSLGGWGRQRRAGQRRCSYPQPAQAAASRAFQQGLVESSFKKLVHELDLR